MRGAFGFIRRNLCRTQPSGGRRTRHNGAKHSSDLVVARDVSPAGRDRPRRFGRREPGCQTQPYAHPAAMCARNRSAIPSLEHAVMRRFRKRARPGKTPEGRAIRATAMRIVFQGDLRNAPRERSAHHRVLGTHDDHRLTTLLICRRSHLRRRLGIGPGTQPAAISNRAPQLECGGSEPDRQAESVERRHPSERGGPGHREAGTQGGRSERGAAARDFRRRSRAAAKMRPLDDILPPGKRFRILDEVEDRRRRRRFRQST